MTTIHPKWELGCPDCQEPMQAQIIGGYIEKWWCLNNECSVSWVKSKIKSQMNLHEITYVAREATPRTKT